MRTRSVPKLDIDVVQVSGLLNLLDQGHDLCSVSTMHRLLRSRGEVRERRDQLRHPAYAPSRLQASAPNQVWTWDITKLPGPQK